MKREKKKFMTEKLVLSQQDVVQQAPSLSYLFPDQYASRFYLVHLHLEIWTLAEVSEPE